MLQPPRIEVDYGPNPNTDGPSRGCTGGPWFDITPDIPYHDSFFTINSYNPTFKFLLNFHDCDASDYRFAVLEDSMIMPAPAITPFSGDHIVEHPFKVGSAIEYDIMIKPSIVPPVRKRYTMVAIDADTISFERRFHVNFEVATGTPVTFDTSGITFFNAFTEERGGLDIDRGRSVPFDSPDAEIQDESIDPNTEGESWRRQISSTNGTEIRQVNFDALGYLVNFENISTKEDISKLFELGSPLTGDDNFPQVPGDTSNNELVSSKIVYGYYDNSGYVVRGADNDYLLRFDWVYPVEDSQEDYYVVSIKY